MMCGYGFGWPLMMLVPLLWIVLIAVIVWAVIRLVQRDGWRGGHGRETPQEILDRRFAGGEIDAEEYRQARAQLSGRESPS